MNILKKAAGFIVLLLLTISIVACSNDNPPDEPSKGDNYGFESGDLSGWTTEGNAFQREGVVKDETVGGNLTGKAGDYYFNGIEADVQSLMLETYQWAMSLGDDDEYIKNFYKSYPYPVELPMLRITQRAEGQAIYASDNVDITGFLTNVKGEKMQGATIITGIESVESDESVITDGFDKADLSIPGLYTVNYYIECDGEKVFDNFKIAAAEDGDILNGDFETGDLAGWTVLTPDTLNANSAISGDSTFWGEDIPFNNHGAYHFNGWTAQYEEEHSYVIKSSNFKLGESGFLTWRMGGNAAAMKVFKADGTLVAMYFNTAFADVNFPNIDEGCRLATMTTFAADLSVWKDEELYIELHDMGGGAWGVAFFDNVNVKLDSAPDIGTQSDTVVFNKKVDETLTPSDFGILWVLAENEA